jgi:hypothetical protein
MELHKTVRVLAPAFLFGASYHIETSMVQFEYPSLSTNHTHGAGRDVAVFEMLQCG